MISGGINKSSANSDPSALLRYARSSLGGLLEFYTDENLSRLLTCTLHFMVDVRKTAGELLTVHLRYISLQSSLSQHTMHFLLTFIGITVVYSIFS
jgi:hypothetical protein